MDQNGSTAMLTIKRSTGVTPEMNRRITFKSVLTSLYCAFRDKMPTFWFGYVWRLGCHDDGGRRRHQRPACDAVWLPARNGHIAGDILRLGLSAPLLPCLSTRQEIQLFCGHFTGQSGKWNFFWVWNVLNLMAFICLYFLAKLTQWVYLWNGNGLLSL